jgi:hypothetical protein
MIDVTGGCACGAVRYRASIPAEGYWCHCRMCQRATGAVAVAFVNTKKARVTWTRGAPAEWASSPIALRGRCAACGTPLTFHYPDSDNIDLTVASLDTPEVVHPASHFGIESRVPGWVPADTLPAMRSEDYQSLQDRWAAAKDTPR